MTRAELRAEVFRRLNESSSAPVFWTVADVDLALDDIYEEFSDQTEWYERAYTIDLLNARPYYDLRTVAPRTVLSVGAAFNTQTNRWLTPSRIEDLEQKDRRWEQRTGEPEQLTLRSPWWLGYWPQVQQDSGTVKQHVTCLPDPMTEDDDEPGFPETLHYGLVEGALADLWSQDGEADRALQAWSAYLAYETAGSQWVDNRASVPMVHGHGPSLGA